MSLYNKIIDQQKLQDAWKQVYKNKPKEGVDGVTCEDFEEDKKNRIVISAFIRCVTKCFKPPWQENCH